MAFNLVQFNNFINRLKSQPNTSSVENQYLSTTQISNLELYLKNLEVLSPDILLIGEAPGYNGCTLSGIPFTSEFIINTQTPPGVLSGCTTTGNQKESSATVVWSKLNERQSLGKLSIPPIIWNIFPFHPHDVGNIKSNRKPNASELRLGLSILNDLIALFPTVTSIYAIGNVAGNKINTISNYAGNLRHPSYGGKSKFNSGMDLIYP
jgi:hypothetical protein